MKTYYEVLGVYPGATQQEIKDAFKAKALVEHPDHGGDPEAWRFVQDAYTILKQPVSRAPYDLALETLHGRCQACDGQGFVYKMTTLFDRKRVECSACKGRGVADG